MIVVLHFGRNGIRHDFSALRIINYFFRISNYQCMASMFAVRNKFPIRCLAYFPIDFVIRKN